MFFVNESRRAQVLAINQGIDTSFRALMILHTFAALAGMDSYQVHAYSCRVYGIKVWRSKGRSGCPSTGLLKPRRSENLKMTMLWIPVRTQSLVLVPQTTKQDRGVPRNGVEKSRTRPHCQHRSIILLRGARRRILGIGKTGQRNCSPSGLTASLCRKIISRTS